MAEYKGEVGYLAMVRDLLEHGVFTPDRTGVDTYALFDAKVVFDHRDPANTPFMAHRPLPLRKAFTEMWFFLAGKTQTKELEAEGIGFWTGNTSREFLDRRGLTHLDEGDMGRAYGAQFRAAGESRYDQLAALFDGLTRDRYSRRHYLTLWSPAELDQMALTPCWHSHQFVVLPDPDGGDDVLHLKLISRSLDSVLGFSAAIHGYAVYQMAVARAFGMRPGRLSADLSQYHIYTDQCEFAREMVDRQIGEPGTVSIRRDLQSLDDVLALSWDDIDVVGRDPNRTPFSAPPPKMAV